MNNAEQMEPGIYGQTDPGNMNAIVNGLASGMGTANLVTSLPSLATGAAGVIKGLGTAGEATLGGMPEATTGANAVSNGLQDIVVYIKGIQKGINGAQEPIYGVRGPAEKLLSEFGDANPGSVPASVLRAKGLLPHIGPQSQNPADFFAPDLRAGWGRAATEQSGTPVSTLMPYLRPDVFLP